MILEKLPYFEIYAPAVKGLKKAAELAEKAAGLEPGKYEMDGYTVMVQTGETTSANQGEYEAHQKFIDVQYVAEGSEVLLWAKTEDLTLTVPYDENIDRTSYQGEGTSIRVQRGQFYVLFPEDAHKACCHVTEKTKYKKVVIKCPV